jgi:TonB family protein
MTRKVIVAALALSPMLLHAQANSPALTRFPANAPVQLSQLTQSKAFAALAGATAAPATNGTLRIASITAPKLISTVEIATPGAFPQSYAGADNKIVVSMIVKEDGKPSNLKIVSSSDFALNQNVLAAVSQYRYKPGTLDNQPTAIPVRLEITLRR